MEENKESNVKLVFDIMPHNQSSEADGTTATEIVPTRLGEKSDLPFNEPAPDAIEPEPKRQSIFSRFLKFRWFLIGLGFAVLMAGSYFAYSYFMPKEPDTTLNEPAQPQEPVLAVAWLRQNFQLEICLDDNTCGANADPDADGMKNIDEEKFKTNPLSADTDIDGISDLDEKQIYGTDPAVSDSDGDGFEDGNEIRDGYSPLADSAHKASAVETQQFQDNLAKFGQHEPTQAFLGMRSYKTSFILDSTSTPYLTASISPDWQKIEGLSKSSDGFYYDDANSATSTVIFMEVRRVNPTTTLEQAYQWGVDYQVRAGTDRSKIKLIGSKEMTIGRQTYLMSESTTDMDAGTRRMLSVLTKRGEYLLTAYIDKMQGDRFTVSDLVFINSVR